MYIKNNKLFLNSDKKADFTKTPNKSGTVKQLYLILHYTASTSFLNTVNWLATDKAKASAHIIIGRNGEIMQMVPFNKKAWHAGKSKWGKLCSMNKYSIGIELVNAGKLSKRPDGKWVTWSGTVIQNSEVSDSGWHTYTDKQIKAATDVAIALDNTYNFIDILKHSDVAPNRKIDPGPEFPFDGFVSSVKGITV